MIEAGFGIRENNYNLKLKLVDKLFVLVNGPHRRA